MRNKMFFMRLLSLYLITIVVYSIIITDTIFIKNNNAFKAEQDIKQQTYLKQVSDKIDTRLMITYNLINQFKSNKNIAKFIKDGQVSYYDMIKIRDLLKETQSAFSGLEVKIALAKLYDDIVILPDFSGGVLHFLNIIGIDQSEKDNILNYFKNSAGFSSYMTIEHRTPSIKNIYTDYITVIRQERNEDGNNFYVFLTFSKNSLLSLPESEITQGIFIKKGDTLISSVQNHPKKDLLNIAKSFDINYQPDKQYNETETSGYRGFSVKSKIIDWDYIYITSNSEMRVKANKLAFFSLLILIILIFVGGIIGYFILKDLYKPIKTTVSVFKDFDINDNRDELSYIQNAALKLSDTNKQLSKTIKLNKISLKEKFLRELIGGLVPQEKMSHLIKDYQIEFLGSSFTLVLLELDNISKLEESFNKDVFIKIQPQLLNVINEQLHKTFEAEVLPLENGRFCLFISGVDEQSIIRNIKDTISYIETNFEFNFIAAIGGVCHELYNIEKSYNNALNIMEHRFALSPNTVLTNDSLVAKQNDIYYYPLEFEKQLISNVIRGNTEQAMTTLQKILTENLKERNLNNEALSLFVFAITGGINRIIQSLNKTTDYFFDDGMIIYIELKMIKNIDELENKIKDMFNTILTKINEDKQKEGNDITDDLLSYIHDNYNKDISLNDIADRFNLSTNYVSILFRNKIGQNFKDYLNIYRIETAKEILSEGKDIKIKELAEKIGFNSVNSFIRAFKKYEGTSPGQYKVSK